jgi:hypothetical protein
MTGLEIALSIAGFAGIGIIALLIVLKLGHGLNRRLMRCPETGSVAFVQTARAAPGADAPEVTVSWCDLWPARKECARGCLVRYPQTVPGYRVNVKALRPFRQP